MTDLTFVASIALVLFAIGFAAWVSFQCRTIQTWKKALAFLGCMPFRPGKHKRFLDIESVLEGVAEAPEPKKSAAISTANTHGDASLLCAMMTVINAYIRLHKAKVLRNDFALTHLSSEQCDLVRQPLQDPLGALFATLRWVRAHPPQKSDVRVLPRARQSSLRKDYRVRMAAVMHSLHKYVHNCPATPGDRVHHCVLKCFLEEGEQPCSYGEWQDLGEQHGALEVRFAAESPGLYDILNHSPMANAEHDLHRLYAHKVLTLRELCILRGCLFFVLGCSVINHKDNVLGHFDATLGPERVGRAAVFLLCHCYCEATNPSKPFDGVFHPDDVLVARKLLKNCLMPHAGYLRLQPYCILDAHPCATVLANTVLERVAKRLDESHV